MMKYMLSAVVVALTLTGCSKSGSGFASAFAKLESNTMEARLGHLPELGEAQCNRNLYIGYRGDDAAPMNVSLNMVVRGDGLSMQQYEREFALETTSKSDLVAGQVSFFPEVISQSCKTVHVSMMTMTCTAANGERMRCPGKMRWQWLQGFKMIEMPKRS